ncbi:MAG: hypothetical protein M1292_14120 [Bacteroidetes bacterium]|nr:hypothetical protein [Bacteroidota bacterium]
MKNAGIVLLLFTLITSCEKKDENQVNNYQISKGYYEGYFDYKGGSYWCEIYFDGYKFEEWPSGGAFFQKSMSCLTVGTFSTKNNTLSFVLGSLKFKDFPEPCTPDMFLPGSYEITNTVKKDSLIFTRGTGDNQIIYFLKKHEIANLERIKRGC